MNRFESFFRENRSRLDTERLDKSIWRDIESSLSGNQKRSSVRLYKIAVSILLFVGLGISAILLIDDTGNSSDSGLILASYSNDLANKEIVYIKEINALLQQIRSEDILLNDESYFNDFILQFKNLENQAKILGKDMQAYGYSEETVEQVIYVYQLKIAVLQMLRDEIKKTNKILENEKHSEKTIQLDI